MSSQLEFDLYNIFAVFIKLVQPLLFKNGPGKQITVISVLFYSSVLENCQISNWLVGGFTCTCHITSIFGYNCLSTWFCSWIYHFTNLCSKQLQYISVLHPEEIWENWSQLVVLGGQKQSSGGGSANIRLITLALA